MKHPPCLRSFLLRTLAWSAGFTLGPLALVASCTESLPAPLPGPAVISIPDATAAADVESDGAAQTEAAATCPPPADPSRCSGSDPAFVFFPALACDPSSGGEAGANAGSGGVDPCALVTSLSVFFTPQACRAFVAAEASGNLSSDAGSSAPVIAEPSDQAKLTPDEWSIFAWDPPPERDALRGSRRRALDLLEPSAYASAPLQGEAYVLEFTQGCTEVMRVMLATTYWAPDPASWAILSSLNGPAQVRVYWMRFSGDAIVSGPLPSAPITITMQNTDGG
jgi:hypothetical protein